MTRAAPAGRARGTLRRLLAPAPALAWSMPNRLARLVGGLVLFAGSMALIMRAGTGAMPWDVLHQGLSRQTGMTLGAATLVVGVLVLLAWWPLRQRPGIGTVANVVVISAAIDAWLAVVPPAGSLPAAAVMLAAGILLNAVATALYVGARLGPGPRDGLMTGLVSRTGCSVRLVRSTIEISVVTVGWLLGGTLGVGTLLFALTIGPLVHALLPRLTAPALPASG